MDQIQIASAAARSQQLEFGAWLKSWQLGQTLQARVLGQTAAGNLLLQAAGHRITARSEAPVATGALLKLEVTGLHPSPSLRIITVTPQGTVSGGPLEAQLQVLLPRRGSVTAPLLALLDPVKSANILSSLGLKNDELARLANSFTPLQDLADPKLLQQAILKSGVFLESLLFRQGQSALAIHPGDLKALLFKLQQKLSRAVALKSGDVAERAASLKALHRDVEGALAAISLSQLATLRVEERDGYAWLFDLPFRHRDTPGELSLKIERDDRQAEGSPNGRCWKVLLRLTLPQWGTVEANLFLQGSKISVVVFADREETAARLAHRLPTLRSALECRGLEVAVLRCHLGTSDQPGARLPWTPGLDEKV